MNSHVLRFYRKFADEQTPIQLYHEVIGLHDAPDLQWEEVLEKAPALPKGWYELSRLQPADRVEFTRDFWLATLPFFPKTHSFLSDFFDALDDIGVYVTQLQSDSPYECEVVYSLKDNSCFYRGTPPCSDDDIEQLALEFDGMLPEDYLSFLKIHDGFSKHSDTGMIRTRDLQAVRQRIREELEKTAHEISTWASHLDPSDLIPFYESFGQSSYQCFLVEWTPLRQVGNVYYSPGEKILSDIRDHKALQENLAFPTFLDWLIFYLESVE